MHTLAREVRFSIDPFEERQFMGFNSYANKPIGSDGLSIYLSLRVELSGELNSDTGFVVNVTEIDKSVRKILIPLITDHVRSAFLKRRVPALPDLGGLLRQCWTAIAAEFSGMQVKQLILNLSPNRWVSIQSEDCTMLYYNEKFEFSAMHQLWNDDFDAAENNKMFGKCANPAGHGHNYILEVKVLRSLDENNSNWTEIYQKTVKECFLDIVDHKNLNMDVPGFEKRNPTVENLASFAWEKLAEKFMHCKLCSITIWENDRTYCTYSEKI